ncbi:hypothetical protein JHK82_040081 [Glycine max]|uniref:Starch synthase catalytic domain-containing protein n=2 Tax=Glycine subgen. Soja TaxID=1462606 RepID=K7M778_SOYBN|nr:hypothetical protein JHK82_040081 [Glycine max]KAG5122153.1 hypothetical protein JHK84_040493 [Glycine max]RZB69197.1 Starch synthase 2, chloroplastic/amyloplastic [Glycine soja]
MVKIGNDYSRFVVPGNLTSISSAFMIKQRSLPYQAPNMTTWGHLHFHLSEITTFESLLIVPWHVPCGGVCYGDGNQALIANDWHTALPPVYLKAYYRDHGLMKYTRSVLVIHNIAHQVHSLSRYIVSSLL